MVVVWKIIALVPSVPMKGSRKGSAGARRAAAGAVARADTRRAAAGAVAGAEAKRAAADFAWLLLTVLTVVWTPSLGQDFIVQTCGWN